MRLVVDASVVVARLFHGDPRETEGRRAVQLFRRLDDGRVTFLQPVHWLAEVAAVACLKDPERCQDMIDALKQLDICVVDDHNVLRTAMTLSIRLKAHLFDTLYHAVALVHEATLVTADHRYLAAARSQGRTMGLQELEL